MIRVKRPMLAPISAGNARSAAARMIQKAIRQTPLTDPVNALQRLNPDQRRIALKVASGMSRRQAAISSGNRESMAYTPHIKAAMDSLSVAQERKELKEQIKGSMMTLMQRRNLALDVLVEIAYDKSDEKRVKAIELLGKTAGLFTDSQPSGTNLHQGNSDLVKQQIMKLLESINGNAVVTKDVTIDGDAVRVNDADSTLQTSQNGQGDV